MRRPALAAACLAVIAAVSCAPIALADGDPASDVLLGANVFYPYTPPVASGLQRTLNGETAAAARAHFHLKVALIDGPFDLGVVPQMFGNPQEYARFLDQELRLFLGPHPPLLVVMPGGYGAQGLPGPATTAVSSLTKPSGRQSDDLARAAIAAVPKLAAAAGHPISAAERSGSDSGSGAGTWALVILALAAIILAGGVLVIRRRLARRG
ncbi:MAG TPA: hypothetical protein VGF70_02880 [Solirubrobacteraceae bacterium]|jgi:hypothetical protein